MRKGRFPDVPAILFEQPVFPDVPCFDFAVVLHFETDQPAICVMCFSLYEGDSGNRRRQDLHPSSSNKPKQCVKVNSLTCEHRRCAGLDLVTGRSGG